MSIYNFFPAIYIYIHTYIYIYLLNEYLLDIIFKYKLNKFRYNLKYLFE